VIREYVGRLSSLGAQLALLGRDCVFPSKLLISNDTLLKELTSLAIFTPSVEREDVESVLERVRIGNDESGEKQTAVEAITSVDSSSSSPVGDCGGLGVNFGGMRPSEHLEPPHPSCTLTCSAS
jgi:hypothetical protein